MILSSSAYLAAKFPDRHSIEVTTALFAALKALNEASHAAMKSARGHDLHDTLMQLRLLTDSLVDRAYVAEVVSDALADRAEVRRG